MNEAINSTSIKSDTKPDFKETIDRILLEKVNIIHTLHQKNSQSVYCF
jgi:hypothetical protein